MSTEHSRTSKRPRLTQDAAPASSLQENPSNDQSKQDPRTEQNPPIEKSASLSEPAVLDPYDAMLEAANSLLQMCDDVDPQFEELHALGNFVDTLTRVAFTERDAFRKTERDMIEAKLVTNNLELARTDNPMKVRVKLAEHRLSLGRARFLSRNKRYEDLVKRLRLLNQHVYVAKAQLLALSRIFIVFKDLYRICKAHSFIRCWLPIITTASIVPDWDPCFDDPKAHESWLKQIPVSSAYIIQPPSVALALGVTMHNLRTKNELMLNTLPKASQPSKDTTGIDQAQVGEGPKCPMCKLGVPLKNDRRGDEDSGEPDDRIEHCPCCNAPFHIVCMLNLLLHESIVLEHARVPAVEELKTCPECNGILDRKFIVFTLRKRVDYLKTTIESKLKW